MSIWTVTHNPSLLTLLPVATVPKFCLSLTLPAIALPFCGNYHGLTADTKSRGRSPRPGVFYKTTYTY
jgi:hypothetical protein